MRAYWQFLGGNSSLPFTYWVSLMVPLWVTTLALYGLVVWGPYFGQYPDVLLGLYGLAVLLVIYVTYVHGLAAILSAWKRQPSTGGWGWLAIAAVLLGWVLTPLQALGVMETPASIEKELEDYVSLTNLGLPQEIDEDTTFEKMSFRYGELTSYFRIAAKKSELDVDAYAQSMHAEHCDIWKREMDAGVIVVVREVYWLENSDKAEVTTTKDDCTVKSRPR